MTKKLFSSSWISSSQRRKQRKMRFNAPLHVKSTFLHAALSKDLKKKYATRAIRIRKGDTAKIMRGDDKGKTGKVDRVSLQFCKVYITGFQNVRKDGTKTLRAFEPSNIQIIQLDTSDKRRFAKTVQN